MSLEKIKKKKEIKKKHQEKAKASKECKKCNGKSQEDGRVCDGCKIFICGDHCQKKGRFCRGLCDKYAWNDCVAKGVLNACQREECTEFLCKPCKYKCEGCWDFLALRGVDDEDIEKALKDGNYSDYIDEDWI